MPTTIKRIIPALLSGACGARAFRKREANREISIDLCCTYCAQILFSTKIVKIYLIIVEKSQNCHRETSLNECFAIGLHLTQAKKIKMNFLQNFFRYQQNRKWERKAI